MLLLNCDYLGRLRIMPVINLCSQRFHSFNGPAHLYTFGSVKSLSPKLLESGDYLYKNYPV